MILYQSDDASRIEELKVYLRTKGFVAFRGSSPKLTFKYALSIGDAIPTTKKHEAKRLVQAWIENWEQLPYEDYDGAANES